MKVKKMTFASDLRMKARFILSCLIFSTQVCSVAYSQRYNFSSFNISHGLPNDQVTCIYQDDIGYLWIGTAYGICRFNGIQFLKFESENPVSQNTIKSIFQDKEGNIWIGMLRKGVARFSGVEFTFLNSKNGLLNDNVNAICQDASGKIWFGTSQGVSIYDGEKFTSLTTNDGLCDNAVTDIRMDSTGSIWVSTLNGISLIKNNQIINYSIDDGLSSGVIYQINLQKDNTPFFSTQMGINLFDRGKFYQLPSAAFLNEDRIQSTFIEQNGEMCAATYSNGVFYFRDSLVKHFTVADGLAGDLILCSYLDKENNSWFGTMNGLTRYSGDNFESFTTSDGLPGNNLLSVYAGKSGKIFFGTLSNGLSVFDGTRFQNYGSTEGLRNKTIWNISEGYNDKVWLSTTGGPVSFNLTENIFDYPVYFLINELVYQVLQIDSDKVFFATDKGLFEKSNNRLTRFGKSQGLTEENVRCLFLDAKNELWIGTLKGLFQLKGDTVTDIGLKYKLPQVPVTCITADPEGRIIVSTFDFGLYIIGEKKAVNLNSQNGLLNSRILKIFYDRDLVWIATPDGLDCMNWKSYIERNVFEVSHFNKGNGYYGIETNSICSDSLGSIWLAAGNGAYRFSYAPGFTKSSIPQLTLNKVQLFLKDVERTKLRIKINPRSGLPVNPVLPFNQNYLSFYFTGIFLSAPEEVNYQYILEGFEQDWNPVTSQTVANYTNLPAGKFTFKVKATVNNREWTPIVTFNFEIKPPIWKTPVAYLFYLLAIVIAVFLILQFRTRNLNRSRLLLKQKVAERTLELNEKNAELEKLSLVASETDNAVMIFNDKLELEWANHAFSKITGYSLNEKNENSPVTIFDLSTADNIHLLVNESITNKKAKVYESRITARGGNTIWVSSTLNPIFDDKGALKKIVVIDTDITLRKNMEVQITNSLHEKGLLLKEIHHRVKNNLQIIISLFNLQSGFIKDESALDALKEGQDRIKSIALIHDRFYQADGTSKIDFDDYIRRLCDSILQSAGIQRNLVKINIKTDRISLNIDQAVPCGLIINEIVNNALKHAFQNGEGTISISFKEKEESVFLEISDNGPGLPPEVDFQNPESLGLQLIHALADQIDAEIRLNNASGVTYLIIFKMN
ncbi:MAG: PAS domain-containing protein [Bacteroidia bacterium]|nr:PAS domain-containing protein [Bacteroidia bacterium]